MAKKQAHTHRLKKHKYQTGNSVYFCTLPDCHYKIEVALALGKRTICNLCGEEFIMTEYTLRLAKPHCDQCGKVKIRDASGNNRYVKKVANRVLTGIAEKDINDLRSRLDSVTSLDSEKDI